MRGTVKNWHEDRGFGFIAPEEGGDDIFVHARSLPEGYLSLARGVTVEFTTFMADKGMQARVTSVGDFAPPADPGGPPQPEARARLPERRPSGDAKHGREPIWTPERRTEMAEKAVEALFKITTGDAPERHDMAERVDAMRLLFEAISDDAREG